jgi:hypothetical protein
MRVSSQSGSDSEDSRTTVDPFPVKGNLEPHLDLQKIALCLTLRNGQLEKAARLNISRCDPENEDTANIPALDSERCSGDKRDNVLLAA